MPETSILQEWEGYVDALDDGAAWLKLADLTDRARPGECGSFPLDLFDGIDLELGTILRIKVMSDRTVAIEKAPIVIRHNAGADLADLIRSLRDDQDTENHTS